MSEQANVFIAGVSQYNVSMNQDGQCQNRNDYLAQEIPVAVVFNGISHAVMMASPLDLEDFALGFALTEGLLESQNELYGIEVVNVRQGIELHLEVSAACEWRLKERRRTLAGRTGCGLCGTDSLDQVHRALKPVHSVCIDAHAIISAEKKLKDWQKIQQYTGATHAAAWVSLTGEILRVREDVGRHNALDKLIGDLVKHRVQPHTGWMFITSRASFEMVQKTISFGAGVLVAISAPTALAVDIAHANNLALAGYVRGNSFVTYTFADRFQLKN